ncbi:helix-turn-helix transcriptional regulator [Blastococcus sp. MG754427]|nr:helix-turn-helix transcriptional regulator [Blastococcus sp. MG754427]
MRGTGPPPGTPQPGGTPSGSRRLSTGGRLLHRPARGSPTGAGHPDSGAVQRDPFDLPGLLRRIRRQADLSQRELAEACDLSQSAVAQAGTGRRDLPATALARAAALGRLRLVLLDEDGAEAPPMSPGATTAGGRSTPTAAPAAAPWAERAPAPPAGALLPWRRARQPPAYPPRRGPLLGRPPRRGVLASPASADRPGARAHPPRTAPATGALP